MAATADVDVSTSTTPLRMNRAPYSVQIDSLNAAMVTWRRDWAKSPFIEGGAIANAIRDVVQQNIVVFVKDTTQANILTDINNLIAAVTQTSYTVTVTLDAAQYQWQCMSPADYSVGFTRMMVNGFVAPVTIQMFRQPNPVAGPY